MRELAVLTFMTLDGVMQAPKMPEEDRSGGFEGGGWADPYWDEVMTLVGKEAMVEPHDVLFGGMCSPPTRPTTTRCTISPKSSPRRNWRH